MEFITTDRGFKHPAPITTEFGQVRVYESSNAMEPCLWLNVTDQTPHATEEKVITSLTLDQAEQLIDTLRWVIDHHYQNEPE